MREFVTQCSSKEIKVFWMAMSVKESHRDTVHIEWMTCKA